MDLWQKLQRETRPIVMYGMGNGADKILAVLSRYGIEVADFFASDGFVRGHCFHGKEVLTYQKVKEKYPDCCVLLSFASAREDVLANIRKIAAERDLYAPDVPVAGDTLFDHAFYTANRSAFDEARGLLADDASRELFDCVIDYKLSGRIDNLLTAYTTEDDIWHNILHPATYRAYADLGAYCGDTAEQAMHYAPSISAIYAMEPDARNFRRLTENASSHGWADKLTATQSAAWDKEEVLTFRQEGNRNAGIGNAILPSGGKLKQVQGMPLDAFLQGHAVDYIKYDVEGAEEQALLGSANTIAQYRPDLCVSAYHRTEDLCTLPQRLKRLCPDYRLTLRRLCGLPAWDLNLYATVRA